jgi:hypothetical protein
MNEKSLLPHIEAPYSITDITSESNNLVNVEYSKPPLVLHLAISKPNDLLADFEYSTFTKLLGLLIAKCKTNGGFEYSTFTKLFDSLVMSVIEYGASIWGSRDFSCINC